MDFRCEYKIANVKLRRRFIFFIGEFFMTRMLTLAAAAALLVLPQTSNAMDHGSMGHSAMDEKAKMMDKAESMAKDMVDMKTTEASHIAAWMHADWCGKCKVLEPKFAEAITSGGFDKDPDIKFVTLNMTDGDTKAEAKKSAMDLGIADIYAKNGGKTGYVAIIDTKTNMVVDRITSDMSVEDMVAKLKDYS